MLVSLENISVRFGNTPVIAGVDFVVSPGEVVGVAGPNGAGKTTLLGVVATLTPPTAGGGSVLGATLGTRETWQVRRRIGWAGHDPGLYPDLTLRENLTLSASIAGLSHEQADAALDAVGLSAAAHRRADRSSNGMQRRIDLARMLMLAPDLVLLDEAHAGLDNAADEIISEILRRTRAKGGGALLVSHDAHRLAEDTDRVLRIERGTVR